MVGNTQLFDMAHSTHVFVILQGHLQFVRPVLATNEMSPGHLYVLKLMLELIDTSLLHSKSVQTDIETDLCSAFSDGAFKLTDPKRFVSDMCESCSVHLFVIPCLNAPPTSRSLWTICARQSSVSPPLCRQEPSFDGCNTLRSV